jgi:hypothetical protein
MPAAIGPSESASGKRPVVVAATGELAERERNSAATFSLDRLFDLVGADGATVTIATSAGVELVVRL